MLLSLCACSFSASKKDPDPDVNLPSNEDLQEEVDPTANGDSEENPGIEEMIEEYHKNSSRDVRAYLFLGIDVADPSAGAGRNDGIYIVAIDNDRKTANILQLNRDTYTDIVLPDSNGNGFTTVKDRLALAFTTGAGVADSCINAEQTISRLLHGLKFDGYIVLYYDAIAPVVDTVGGVDITMEDDMTAISPDFVQGATLHLDGNGAYKFCRARTAVGDQANSGRMRRQRAFLGSFIGVCRTQVKERSSIINDIYNAASPYIVSDLSASELCNIGVKALSYGYGGIVSPAGREDWIIGDDGIRFNIFTVDENSLSGILKDLFALEK